jgi:SAM-dependent methyltransferase
MYIFQPDRFLLRKQVKAFSHYISGKVLDIGAGGFDRYEELLSVKEKVNMDVSAGKNVDVVGSAENIPFPDNSFDSAICTQVFEHLKNPDKAASEIYRVLRKGGFVLITVPQTNELHEEPNDYFRYTKYGIKYIFEKAGFTTEDYEQRGGYYSNIAQIKTRRLLDILDLHKRPFLGWIFGKVLSLYGRFMIWLDSVDKGTSNRKHAIGWCFVFKK